LLTLLTRFVKYSLIFILGGLVVFVAGDIVLSLRHPELQPWHTIKLEHEFAASMEQDFNWDRYLELEQTLFNELENYQLTSIQPAIQLESSRYQAGGNKLQRRLDQDWNRSYRLDTRQPRGVALLVHGLSDSPYSLKNIAQHLNKQGIIVYGLRLPGHGTLPSGLDDIEWQDWLGAVRIVDNHIRQHHSNLPYYYFGYSMGAALGIKLTLDAIANNHKTPDQLVLLSPALGVSKLARFANLQRILSGNDMFAKARWLDVRPEYDPYKYNSFTKNAGRQIAQLIIKTYADIEALQKQGMANQLPPVISFQSVVDATVNAVDLVDKLYTAIDNDHSELVLFDVNQMSYYKDLISYDPDSIIQALRGLSASKFQLTLITNHNENTPAVTELNWSPHDSDFTRTSLPLVWPQDIYSLSHTSLPFPPHDPIYGYNFKNNEGRDITTLGNLSVRGEQGVLTMPAGNLLRLRSNPFYSYIEQRITEVITKKPD
jgi:alpha-beta hydrolase superfamily lysophospholipase